MPPKVKSALAPEPMATQPDSPEPDTQSVTETEKPPKKKNKNSAKAKGETKNKSREGRPSNVTLVKMQLLRICSCTRRRFNNLWRLWIQWL